MFFLRCSWMLLGAFDAFGMVLECSWSARPMIWMLSGCSWGALEVFSGDIEVLLGARQMLVGALGFSGGVGVFFRCSRDAPGVFLDALRVL